MKSQVRINAENDPNYRPYCLKCSTMERMTTVEPFLWKCKCGAVHDERICPVCDSFGRSGQEHTRNRYCLVSDTR